MSRVLIGWVLIVMVAALSVTAAGRVPSRWGVRGVLLQSAVQLGPVGFTGWALTQLGVRFLGGQP